MTAEDIVQATNDVRDSHGLNTLRVNGELVSSAKVRADELCYKPFSHDGWEDTLTYYGNIGENLAKNYFTPDETLAALMASQTHKDNILGNYEEMGAAVTHCNDGKVITVQHFGYPYQAPKEVNDIPFVIGLTILCIVFCLVLILRRDK